MKNIINMMNMSATNKDKDPKFQHKYKVYQFGTMSDETQLVVHFDNLINHYGCDKVEQLVKSYFNLKTKAVKKVG